MKKAFTYLIIITISIIAGYWLNEVNRFAKAVADNVQLKPLPDTLIYTNPDEKFKTFIFDFMNDSIFQSSRIEFPIDVSVTNEDFETISYKINKSDWQHDLMFANSEFRIQFYDNWDARLSKTNQRLIVYHGIDNGIRIEYYFKLIGEKWYLIKYADYST